MQALYEEKLKQETSLIKIDAFRQALAEAKTIPEVKDLVDQSDLFRQWLKKQRAGRQAQNAGAEMCLMGQRKLGWMLSPEQIEREAGERIDLTSLQDATRFTPYQEILKDNNIEPTASHRWQKLAEIPETDFQEFIQQYQEAQEEITTIAFMRFYYKKIIQPLTEQIPLPEGEFEVIVCDPPWQYSKVFNPDGKEIGARYPEMTYDQLASLEIPATENSVLWLWTTNAFMHDAYHLLDIWEFEPKTILTWFKGKKGFAYWLFGETEHCLLAKRGSPTINHTGASTALFVEKRDHSQKPDEFFKLVEDFCPGRKLEMFARKNRPNWVAWGNEVHNG